MIIFASSGIVSLVDYGLGGCFGGFERNPHLCHYILTTRNYDPSQNRIGRLTYKPDSSKSAPEIIDELALLLTGGRLHNNAKSLIIDAYESADTNSEGLQTAQKLMAAVPEFHTTNVVQANSFSRSKIDIPQPSQSQYKAVVFLYLDGGCDSFNMLVPHSGCSGKDMYNHYKDLRVDLAVPKDDLLTIDASGSEQVCSTFGIHPDLPILKTMYDEGDLLWMSNLGVLQRETSKESWIRDTSSTNLFAHNFQQREVQNIDIFESQAGRGIGGRMSDALLRLGYNAGTVSATGIADALISYDASQFVVDEGGFESFNPSSESDDFLNSIKDANPSSAFGSGLFGETWSSSLIQVCKK